MKEEIQYPMPQAVEAMTKEEMWQWVARSQHAAKLQVDLDRKIFRMTTKLHPSYSHLWQLPWTIINLQAQRIQGLEQQCGEMSRGYDKKLKKEIAKMKNN